MILLCLLVYCIGLGAWRTVLQPQKGWFRDTVGTGKASCREERCCPQSTCWNAVPNLN